ncbi:hypothetical protein PS467_09515 [Streptomyces luomodiensis]|uniref:Integral membrane protein n=1 Tax=Streptomyces luomodiensis TaxID=3026192 RepID=A0ABY9USM4_9ACTN|nr:hypothetical protein [Streptomyces sp. SCA4-21]WNE95555.1 hypothetical protein PS467_09515 [Streptomyces sp. SCA4-21]
MEAEQTTRREAAIGAAGCLTAVFGCLAGFAAWLPYGRRALFGGFEGETNPDVLWLGLPVLVLSGTAAALAVFVVVRGRWRTAIALVAAVAGLAAIGYGFDVLAGPPTTRHCAPSC